MSHFRNVNEILAEALSLSPSERGTFVEQRCTGDTTLRDSVFRLLRQFEQLGDFLEEPAVFHAGIRPGDLISGRFRITHQLGAGGMGEIYQAIDELLHETVAVKTIRSDIRGDTVLQHRFRDEIRLARKISHPNVCPVYEVFSSDSADPPFLFCTMKFLEGETLAAVLECGGPLSPSAALDLAGQIAAGLDAAHAQGIIHRDLKPANIMIETLQDGGRRAVIMDFGLARPLADIPGNVTQAGQMLGTPRYMAPEQFLSAQITAAADIYAFALIVLEMVSGKRLFPDESVLRTAVRRASQDAPRPSGIAPTIPNTWDAVLSRALSREPLERPPSASQLVRALVAQGPRFPQVTRRNALRYSAIAAAVSGLVLALRLTLWKRTRLPTVPVLMFANASSTQDENRGAAAFIVLLDRQLDTTGIRSIPRDRIRDIWQRMGSNTPLPDTITPRDARDLALRGGANLVAFVGTTRKLEDWSFWVRLEVLGTSTSGPISYWDHEFRAGHSGDRFTAAVEGARWLRETVRPIPLPGSRERTPQELTTSSWEALEEYLQANDLWAAGDRDGAIRRLRSAIDLDPEFPLALSRIGDLLTATGHTDEGLLFHSRAAEMVRRRNLTDRESLNIRVLFALDAGESAEAEQAAARWAAGYADDPVALIHQATALEWLGNADGALHLLDVAVGRMPESNAPLTRRCMLLLRSGRFMEAERDCELLAKIPPTDFIWQFRGALAVARLDFSGAWQALEEMRRANPAAQSAAFAHQACQRAEQGRQREAADLLASGIRFDRERSLGANLFRKLILLAQLRVLEGDHNTALRAGKDALAAAGGQAARMEAGCVLAQAGDLRAAQTCLPSDLAPWPIYQYWAARLRAEIDLAASKPHPAFDRLRSAPPNGGRSAGEWPLALVRAAVAAGEPDFVKETVTALLTNPARYWFNADFIGPGYLRWCLNSLGSYVDPALQGRATQLRSALARSA